MELTLNFFLIGDLNNDLLDEGGNFLSRFIDNYKLMNRLG